MDAIEKKTKKSQRKRVSADQLEYVLTFMEANPNLKNGVLTPNFTKQDRKDKWEELTESLNALVGSVKTPELWKKTWNDQKSYVRAKAARIKKAGVEDGSSSSDKLSPMEERILNLVGWGAGVEYWDSKVVETKANSPPSDTEHLFSDDDDEVTEYVIDREPFFSEEETEFNDKVNDSATKSIPIPGCSGKAPPKKQRMTLCGMTAAALEELRHHGQLMARNATVQEETLAVMKAISDSLMSISENLEKIADVAVNRI